MGPATAIDFSPGRTLSFIFQDGCQVTSGFCERTTKQLAVTFSMYIKLCSARTSCSCVVWRSICGGFGGLGRGWLHGVDGFERPSPPRLNSFQEMGHDLFKKNIWVKRGRILLLLIPPPPLHSALRHDKIDLTPFFNSCLRPATDLLEGKRSRLAKVGHFVGVRVSND